MQMQTHKLEGKKELQQTCMPTCMCVASKELVHTSHACSCVPVCLPACVSPLFVRASNGLLAVALRVTLTHTHTYTYSSVNGRKRGRLRGDAPDDEHDTSAGKTTAFHFH